METKKVTPEMLIALKEPLPREAVKPHPTKTYLSSIKAIYVTERLTNVFGLGAWKLTSEFIAREGKMVVVKAKISIPEYGIEYESYGGNDNTDLGDAYKGAVTDAITKIGSWLNIGIDVFKGNGAGPPPPPPKLPPPPPKLPPPPKQNPLFPSKSQNEKKFMEVVKMLREGTYVTKDGENKKFTIGTIEGTYLLTPDVKQELLDEAAKTF